MSVQPALLQRRFCSQLDAEYSAVSAVCVDPFQDASDTVTANAEFDVLDENVISFVKTATDTEEEFDVIVLDPLKLSTSISSLDKAS